MAAASVALAAGSAPPSLAATMIARESLVKSLPRFLSSAPFLCLIVDHLEWPLMPPPPRGASPTIVGEAPVQPPVVGQLGMEGRHQHAALCAAATGWPSCSASTSTPGAGALDPRRADEHAGERLGIAGQLELAPRSSPPGGRRRFGARRCRSAPGTAGRASPSTASSRHQDHACAGAEHRRAGRMQVTDRLLQPVGDRSACDIVVDSPPGITRPCSPASSSGWRTSTGSRPTSASARMCSRNAPCRARTPTRVRPTSLPATRLQQAVLAERRHLDADHRLAQPGRHLGQRSPGR